MDTRKALSILQDQEARPLGGWSLLGRRPPSPAPGLDEAFQALADASPEEILPPLAVLVWNAGDPSERLRMFFLSMAGRLPASSWPQVEETIRRLLDYEPPSSRSSPHGLVPGNPSLILVALCHPSGHLREKAVRLSSGLASGLEEALLAVRVNDWVAPVREAAAARLETIVKNLDPVRKITLLPLLMRLRECGRHRYHGLLGGWMTTLATNLNEQAWLAAWLRSVGKDRKRYLEMLRVSGHTPGPEIRRALIASNDRRALHWLIREVMPALDEEERGKLLLAVRKSRAVVVKREWLNHHIASGPPKEVESILTGALLDRSRGIRQFARFHLAKIRPVDFTGFYQEAMRDPATEAVALSGLSEVDPPEAHQEAVLRLDSEVPAVMKAALESLEPASLGGLLPILLEKMDSPLPGVPKAARKRLTEIRRLLGMELVARPEIWECAGDSARSYFIRNAPEFQKWDGLEFLLVRATGSVSRDNLVQSLETWTRKEPGSFARLSPAKREELLEALDRARLPFREAENIRFIISHAE